MTDSVIVVGEELKDVAGAVCFWRLEGDMDTTVLEGTWRELGLPEDQLPGMPSLDTALRRAVKAQGQRQLLVRPLSRGKWALVRETEGGDATLDYHQEVTVSLVETDDSLALEVFPQDHALAPAIRAAFAIEQGRLSANDVSVWLVRRAEGLGAVSMRDTGGIYFLPRPALAAWRLMVEAVRAASSHRLFEIPALKSDEAVQAVLDAVTREAEAEAATLGEKLDGDLGARGLRNASERAKAMVAKVQSYERLLDVGMEGLRTRLGDLQANLAAAALAATDDSNKEAA